MVLWRPQNAEKKKNIYKFIIREDPYEKPKLAYQTTQDGEQASETAPVDSPPTLSIVGKSMGVAPVQNFKKIIVQFFFIRGEVHFKLASCKIVRKYLSVSNRG